MKTRKTKILCLEICSLDMEDYTNILHRLIIITKKMYIINYKQSKYT